MLVRTRFWDRSKERAFARAKLFAQLVRDEPRRAAEAAAWIEARWPSDAAMDQALRGWRELLALPPDRLAVILLGDDERGEFLRDTLPPVFPIDARRRAAMLRRVG